MGPGARVQVGNGILDAGFELVGAAFRMDDLLRNAGPFYGSSSWRRIRYFR